MTTDHTELCERLRQASIQCSDCGMYETSSDFDLAVSTIESQAARIQQQAARIAELERERDALKADAEGYRLIRTGRAYVEPEDIDGRVYVSIGEHGRYCRSADEFDAEIAAALQAEKEGRDER